ncbi:MAG: glycosyltransferase [Anaerolineae bacterium]|nr:glycosyltransferase [Anaerolineae bacterium]
MTRILFIASLHHPQQLQKDRAIAKQTGQPSPLFPNSTSTHFWEKALRKRGYTVDVFWRNLSGFGNRDVQSLKADVYTERLTPSRILKALNHRLPYALNPDLRRRNALLVDYARRFQPDYLWILGDNRVIHADTLSQIKAELGCRIIYSTGTSPIVFSHAIERQAAELYDLVIVNDYYHGIQWLELGAKKMTCLPFSAVDPDFHQPKQLSDKERESFACDVSFVGTLLPTKLYRERVDALAALSEFNVGIWTVHDVPDRLKSHLRGYALGETMLRVLSGATISLNVHGDFMRYGGNMRLFEAAGVGAFQISDNRVGIHEWFTVDEHLVVYDSLDDLREKVRYYLAHPQERQEIATAARQHALQHHTYDQRLTQLEHDLP